MYMPRLECPRLSSLPPWHVHSHARPPVSTRPAAQAFASCSLTAYPHFFAFPSGGNGGENQLSDGEAEKKRDAADYLDFLSSEFMARLNSAGDAHAQRRQSRWKRDFEHALDKRKRKQARSDEFFEIYRWPYLRCEAYVAARTSGSRRQEKPLLENSSSRLRFTPAYAPMHPHGSILCIPIKI